MRVLVTGGAGYVGSNLVDTLLAECHEVWVVDNLFTGKLENIQHLLGDKRFHFHQDTILKEALMDRLVAGVDLVYHLAAVVGVKYVVEDPLHCIKVNVGGTEVVLERAFAHGKRVVVVSSSEVYGKSPAVPYAEGNDLLLGPTTAPRWSYALAKALDEHLALAYAQKGLAVSAVRYFNSYGPRLDPNGYGSVVARFITQALAGGPLTVHGDGQQSRCFTYVADTVRGTILAGTVPEAVGQVFNLGGNREMRIAELAQLIRARVGSDAEIVHVPYCEVLGPNFEDPPRRVPDTRRAAEVLGFRAETPLEEGLEKTIRWFREN